MEKLRAGGLDKPVLFDGTGYAGVELPVEAWVSAQRRAGADRLLLPGVLIPWDKDGDSQMLGVIAEQARMAADLDATLLLAIDGRLLARRRTAWPRPHRRRAPRRSRARRPERSACHQGSGRGTRSLAGRAPHLGMLRCDHGELGAVAIGGGHAAMGLSTSTRHLVATGMKAHRVVDNTARVFVRSVLDWYRAAEIAGWSAPAHARLSPPVLSRRVTRPLPRR